MDDKPTKDLTYGEVLAQQIDAKIARLRQRAVDIKIARLRQRLKDASIDGNVRAILLGILDLLGDEL